MKFFSTSTVIIFKVKNLDMLILQLLVSQVYLTQKMEKIIKSNPMSSMPIFGQ